MKKYLVVLTLINLLFFIPFFIQPQLLSRKDNDLGRSYIPIFQFFRDTVYEYKQFPLWRPDQMMGESFSGNPLYAAFYPANLLFLIFNINIGVVIYLLLHFLISSYSTYFLAKSFKFSNISSFSAAIFYTFSIKIISHLEAGHITMVAAFCLFPLLFLAAKRTFEKTKPKWLILSATTASLIYIAYATVFYYAMIFLSCFALFKIIEDKFSLKKTKQIILSIILIVLVFISFSAISLLPHLEFAKLSTRTQLRLEDVAIPLWNLKKFIVSFIFPYYDLLTINHEEMLYLGSVPFIFSIISFFRMGTKYKIFLSIFVILVIFYVAGLSTPVFKAAYNYLPLLKYSRVTTRLWFIVALVVSLLAAKEIGKTKNPKIILLLLLIFLTESFFIFQKRHNNLPELSVENEKLYAFLKSDQEIFRVYCTSACFNPQLLSSNHIQILNGENPIQTVDFVKFLQKAGNYSYSNFAVIFPPYQVWQVQNPPVPNVWLLGEANVKYVASKYKIENENLKYIGKFSEVNLYENSFFRKRIRFENDQEANTQSQYSPNVIKLNFPPSDKPRNLIIAQSFYPGWEYKISGRKFEMQKKDQLPFLYIPPDIKEVELAYKPKSLKIGGAITLATIFFSAILFYKKRLSGK